MDKIDGYNNFINKLDKIDRWGKYVNRTRLDNIDSKSGDKLSDKFKDFIYDFIDDDWDYRLYKNELYRILEFKKEVLNPKNPEDIYNKTLIYCNELKSRLEYEDFNCHFTFTINSLEQNDLNKKENKANIFSFKGLNGQTDMNMRIKFIII